MKEKNMRIDYVDIMKAIGIILVVLGHINSANTTIKGFIYAFHMPLFFFAYGLTIKNKQEYNGIDFKKILNSRINGILIPYFIWAFIYSPLSIENIIKILYGSYQTIGRAESLTSLWFLTCMFVATILFELIRWFSVKKQVSLKVTSVISVCICIILCIIIPNIKFGYPYEINVAICALLFILIGYLVKEFLDKKEIKIFVWIIVTIVAFAGIFLYSFNTITDSKYIMMAEAKYGNFLIFIISALSGCICTMGISIILSKILNQKIKNVLIYIGQNTLVIFLTHKIFINLFCKITEFISVKDYIVLIFVTVLTVVSSIIVGKIIEYVIPVLIGKQKEKTVFIK